MVLVLMMRDPCGEAMSRTVPKGDGIGTVQESGNRLGVVIDTVLAKVGGEPSGGESLS